MTLTQEALDVAVVGGGVCGLTLAVALKKKGINAHIYEAAAKFGEVGAGLGIGANALAVLREIGVYEDLMKYMPDPTKANMAAINCVFGNDGHENIYALKPEQKKAAGAIHRATFLQALVGHIDPEYTHFKKRCASITQTAEKATVRFTDGTTVDADVVLVANGINSSVRGTVMKDAKVEADIANPDETQAAVDGLSYSNTSCYRGLVMQQHSQKLGVDTSMWQSPLNLIGKGKHVIVYPINKGQMINVVAYVSDHSRPLGSVKLPPTQPLSQEVASEELLEAFPASDWSEDVRNLLKCIEKPSKWYINIVYPHLETYARGRVALLGDAAHGMLPHLGSGAAQGIEDGYLLAQLLSHLQATKSNVEQLLQVYSDLRRPRSQRVLDLSVQTGLVYDGHGPHGFRKEGMRTDLLEIEKWMDEAYTYTLGADVEEAVEILKEKGVFV